MKLYVLLLMIAHNAFAFKKVICSSEKANLEISCFTRSSKPSVNLSIDGKPFISERPTISTIENEECVNRLENPLLFSYSISFENSNISIGSAVLDGYIFKTRTFKNGVESSGLYPVHTPANQIMVSVQVAPKYEARVYKYLKFKTRNCSITEY